MLDKETDQAPSGAGRHGETDHPNSIHKKQLGELLKTVRLKKRISQSKLAQAANRHEYSISAWEHGNGLGTVVAFIAAWKKLGYTLIFKKIKKTKPKRKKR